ncbi:MAG TPA: hypothetical protein VKA60_03180 [Blastocatellia bacterium]|nr:hypothetical protein [Blastocatellia bacterium]
MRRRRERFALLDVAAFRLHHRDIVAQEADAAHAQALVAVLIINGSRRNALLYEVFTDEGAGSMITS